MSLPSISPRAIEMRLTCAGVRPASKDWRLRLPGVDLVGEMTGGEGSGPVGGGEAGARLPSEIEAEGEWDREEVLRAGTKADVGVAVPSDSSGLADRPSDTAISYGASESVKFFPVALFFTLRMYSASRNPELPLNPYDFVLTLEGSTAAGGWNEENEWDVGGGDTGHGEGVPSEAEVGPLSVSPWDKEGEVEADRGGYGPSDLLVSDARLPVPHPWST